MISNENPAASGGVCRNALPAPALLSLLKPECYSRVPFPRVYGKCPRVDQSHDAHKYAHHLDCPQSETSIDTVG